MLIYRVLLVFYFFMIWRVFIVFFFFSSRRRHTRSLRDWSSDVCSSDLIENKPGHDHERLNTLRGQGGKCPFEIVYSTCSDRDRLQADGQGRGLRRSEDWSGIRVVWTR